jgi:hypothetical protein
MNYSKSLLIISLLVALITIVPAQVEAYEGKPNLIVEPNVLYFRPDVNPVGYLFQVTIWICNVTTPGFFGWEFVLSWTPSVVNCTSETLNLEIWGAGNYLGPWVPKPINNTSGEYHQCLTAWIARATPKSGTVWLATLTFKIVTPSPPEGEVYTALHLAAQKPSNYCIADKAANEIAHDFDDGEYHYTWTPAPPNTPPHEPTAVSQYKSDGVTVIPEGEIVSESTVVFEATVSDPDKDSVRLEIELRKIDEAFTGNPTPETIGDFVPSGTQVRITRYELGNAEYHWRYRAKDIHGDVSDWTEFGVPANIDFEVNDAYWLAKAIMSEAGNCSEYEQIAVGWTVINRLNTGRFGDSTEYIVKKWYRYNQEPTENIESIAKDILENEKPDPTDGATQFFSPRLMTSGYGPYPVPGTTQNAYYPSWAEPRGGWETITQSTTHYVTINNELEWRQLEGINNSDVMFYRPYIIEISARIESSAELRVYDSYARATGLVNGEISIQIPRSNCFENTVTIFFPNETYKYMVVGRAEGFYSLIVTANTREEDITFTAINIPTSKSAIHLYSIGWDALSQGGEGVTAMVNSDGDGHFECTFTSDGELTDAEFMSKTATTIDFYPHRFDLNGEGEWLTAYIELPSGNNPLDIKVSAIRLNGTVLVDLNAPTSIGDYDVDGIADLMVNFNRTEVLNLILAQNILNGNATLTVTVELYVGITFRGDNIIKVRAPGDINGDGMVNFQDTIPVGVAFGSKQGDPNWNQRADENEDGYINFLDVILIGQSFGNTYP